MELTTIYLDWETFFDRKAGYDLKAISMVEYIRSPLFKTHCVGLSVGGQAIWLTDAEFRSWAAGVNWAACEIVCHNARFDGAILSWLYGINPARWVCTQAMSRAVLGATVPFHALKALAEHFGLPAKGEMKTDGLRDLTKEQLEELAAYCCRDVDITVKLHQILKKDFPENQYQLLDWQLRAFIEPKLLIDPAAVDAVAADVTARKAAILADLGISEADLASNKKFPLILESLGVEVPMKISKQTGKVGPALALGDPGFVELLNHADEKIRTVVQARVEQKKVGELARAQGLKELAPYSSYKYPFDTLFSGAHTHRSSGADGAGGNPQNFGRKSGLRGAFVPPEGWDLWSGDLAGIEKVILKFASGEKHLGYDPKLQDDYALFASQIYGRPVTKESDPDARQVGKEGILSLGYGAGWKKFKDRLFVTTGLRLTEKEARKVVTTYRKYYARVPWFWSYCDEILNRMANGQSGEFYFLPFLRYEGPKMILPSGLAVHYKNLRKEKGVHPKTGKPVDKFFYERARKGKMLRTDVWGGTLTENICQALAGEVKKLATRRLLDKGYAVVGEIHDELLILTRQEERAKAKEDITLAMTTSPEWWQELKLNASINFGRSWKEAK